MVTAMRKYWLESMLKIAGPVLSHLEAICVGSLYLCQSVFLPLGLSDAHPFWQEADQAWTARKIWSGENVPCDHALEG